MAKVSHHFFDNLEHGRGRRLPVRKKEPPAPEPGSDRKREKRHQRRPFPHMTLEAALKKALATPALRRQMSVVEIAAPWEELVGAAVAQHVQPASLEKGVLVLQTDSSVWRQQISLMRTEILEKVRGRFGDETVKQVRVK